MSIFRKEVGERVTKKRSREMIFVGEKERGRRRVVGLRRNLGWMQSTKCEKKGGREGGVVNRNG